MVIAESQSISSSLRSRRVRSVQVREASGNDYSAIVALESRYALQTKSYDEWTHLWDANPVYQEIGAEWQRGWVLETRDDRVVGYLGNIPLPYEVDGKPVVAMASHAWVVDAPFRNYSILLLERCFRQENVDLFLNTSSNRQSSGILALYSSRVPVGAWDQSIFWITNYDGFATGWLSMKGAPALGLLSYVLSRALVMRDLANGSPGSLDRGVNVEFLDSFDERFDLFWTALRKQLHYCLLAVRTREVLQWHFKYALLKQQVWIVAILRGTEILAYSIFFRQDNAEYGLTRMRLVDFQCLNGNIGLLLSMLHCVVDRCRKEKIHMLECVGITPELKEVVASLRPYQRSLPSWLYYYKVANQNLTSRLTSSRVWIPSCFDGDLSL
jgi:hypothetical protein